VATGHTLRREIGVKMDCCLCYKPLPQKDLQQRISRSKTGLLFCNKEEKNEALRLGIKGDERFSKLVPSFYKTPEDIIIKECPGCLKNYSTKLSGQKYCSKKCPAKHKNRIKLNNWLAGDWNSAQSVDGSILGWARNYLLEKTQYRCSKCCWSEVGPNGNIPLEIDHIDGDWRNSNPDNLRVLCPNCHALTDNWKVYNKGNKKSRYSYWKEQGWH
jgi:hypothetical protein